MAASPTRKKGSDGKKRCQWANAAPEFPAYHDKEWGFPVGDDRRLFEKLCLESFQSGLSWRTILGKRENFREAFHNFEIEKIARYGPHDIARLMNNAGIVRNRAKIEAVINNAQRAEELTLREGAISAFVWGFEPDSKELPEPQTVTTSPQSIAFAKELKKRGWKFVGPTTAYAFMQAMGLVNDHVHECYVRAKVAKARKGFVVP